MLAVMQLLHGLGFPNAYLPTASRGGTMKSSHHFREQLSVITGWFEQWNDCEQTVALYSLMKKLGPAHTRFLALVLEQDAAECVELQLLEQKANDPMFISNLSAESKETAVAQLLSHLPLLRPGNEEAKAQYLELIPKILAHSIRHSVHIEESRQLLSYSLIHPAITSEDRCSLTQWLRQLEDRIHNSPVYPSVQGYSNGVILNATNGPLQPSQTIDSFGNGQFNNVIPRLDLWQPRNLMPVNGSASLDISGYSVLSNLGSNSLPSGVSSHHMNLHGLNSSNLSSHPDGTQTLPMLHSRVKRSSSLTPPGNVIAQSSCSPSSSHISLDQENLPFCQSTLRVDHAPLSPQSSVTSSGSGSDGQKDEKDVFSQDGTGMKGFAGASHEFPNGWLVFSSHKHLKQIWSPNYERALNSPEAYIVDSFKSAQLGSRDVPCWLKGLRLHKYSYIFKNMTYEEMMSITEEKLERMNITKGARHKIVLSIQKLRERQGNLRSLEKDIQDGEGTIRCALNEIKSMIQTPIKAFKGSSVLPDSGLIVTVNGNESETSDPPSSPPSPTTQDGDTFSQVPEGDLPGQITRLLGKICSTLLISPNQDENMNLFVMIIDKCLSHEAFTPTQKRRLFSWKQQVQKACHPLPPRRSLDNRQRNKWNNYSNGNAQNPEHEPIGGSVSLRRRIPVQYQQPPQRMAVRQTLSSNFASQSSQRNPLSGVIKRPSLQDHMKPHVQIQRTNSAPVRPNPIPVSMFGKSTEGVDSNDPEINNRLESLCLSVTEHALGSFDGAVPLF